MQADDGALLDIAADEAHAEGVGKGFTMFRNRIRLLSAAAGLTLLPLVPATVSAAPAAFPEGTGATACWVRNERTRMVRTDLQVAISAARSGDTLRVRGTCAGTFTTERDLALVGPATLTGTTCGPDGCSAGIVLWNTAAVSLRGIVVTGGSSTWNGGGIHNYGSMTLTSSVVAGNVAEDGGGGIYNEGRLTLASTRVIDNHLLGGDGGGILNLGTVEMNGTSTVAGNTALQGGGVFNAGTIVLNRASSITGNTADTGGGLFDTTGRVWFSPRWHGTLCGNTPDDWRAC